jgi:subtilisin-like proprotein convertase family protein
MNEQASTTWKSRLPVVALVGALLVSGIGPGTADTAEARNRANGRKLQQFSNSSPIAIASNTQVAPSTITVSGFDTPIADVNVSLNALTHPTASDLDILLVGPGGQTALLMSEAGGAAANDSLTFDDQAADQVANSDSLVSGIFQPTNYDFTAAPDTFAPPAPANPSSGSALAVFNGTNANGAWTLFIKEQDNLPAETGAINGGWSLSITTANGVPTAAPDRFQAQAGQTLTVPASGVLQNDADPDGDTLTAVIAGQPTKGQVELAPDGGFSYLANKKAKGTDSFTYLAQDTTGLTDFETVEIEVKGKKHKKGKKGKKGKR